MDKFPGDWYAEDLIDLTIYWPNGDELFLDVRPTYVHMAYFPLLEEKNPFGKKLASVKDFVIKLCKTKKKR